MDQPKKKRMKYDELRNGRPRLPKEYLALPKQELDAYHEIERTMQVGALVDDICTEGNASFPLETERIQLLDMDFALNLKMNSQQPESSPELATARAWNTALHRAEALLDARVLQQINIDGNSEK